MNTPPGASPAPDGVVGLRDQCGLSEDVPLLVYSGGVTAARGVLTAVDALPELPGVHLAVVCVPHTRVAPAKQLRSRAVELGVSDRLHLVEPVTPDAVTAFVTSADVGIIPLLHYGSHEVALANKLFEYLFAGLPVLVSDCRAQADFVREHEVGGVHLADDPVSFAAELRALLDRLPEVRRHIAETEALLDPYHWEHQARNLRGLYRELLGPDALAEPGRPTMLTGLVEGAPPRDDRPSVVGIGPANMAGQASAWARALTANIPGLRTHVTVVDRNLPLLFPGDQTVPSHVYSRDQRWSQAFQGAAQQEWTHALLESGRPLFGLRNGRTFEGDVRVLRAVGIRVGLILHGSEIRDPRRHATLTPWSPFHDPEDELTARLQTQRDTLAAKVETFITEGHGPVFVTTPELLADAPGSVWLPVVVDPETWAGGAPPMTRERPVVLHAPSRAALKGSAAADEVLSRLDARGLVDYRRIEDVPPEQMPALVRDADIVLDQFALGIYGVMAAQVMAAGRVLVLGPLLDDVRRVTEDAAGMSLPVVEATPDTLADVLEGLVLDRDGARVVAEAGPAFVERVHDGRLASEVLTEHLELRGR
ncbi:glycosyltransferase [Ornithinimicrobium sp. W1665]